MGSLFIVVVLDFELIQVPDNWHRIKVFQLYSAVLLLILLKKYLSVYINAFKSNFWTFALEIPVALDW